MQLGFTLIAVVVALGLFLAMLLFLEIGRRFGVRRLGVPGARNGIARVDSTIYGLFALLLGFSFNGAANRFDHRRELVGQASNSARTAWQRIDLLAPEAQPPIRAAFRSYLDALIASYAAEAEKDSLFAQPASLTRAKSDLWTKAAAACVAETGEKARMLLLPALNDLFQIVESERLARSLHPPWVVFAMLGLSALVGSLLVGHALAEPDRRNWLYMIGIAATIASATYVIVELEFPRIGFVRIGSTDRALVQVRESLQ